MSICSHVRLRACCSTMSAASAARNWRRGEGMTLDDLKPTVLHEYLDQVQSDLGALHDAVAKQYFHLH